MLRKTKFIAFCLFLTLSTFPAITKSGYAGEDWGQITDIIIKLPVGEKTKMIIWPETKLRDDAERLYYQQYRVGFRHNSYDWLQFETYYHYSETKSSSTGKWSGENRLIVGAKLKKKFWGLIFSDRHRLEARYLFDHEKCRYRNEFKISKTVDLLGTRWSPYVANEIFYDMHAGELHMNWTGVGVFKRINKNLGINLYYRYESYKGSSDWSGRNFIGITTIVSF